MVVVWLVSSNLERNSGTWMKDLQCIGYTTQARPAIHKYQRMKNELIAADNVPNPLIEEDLVDKV